MHLLKSIYSKFHNSYVKLRNSSKGFAPLAIIVAIALIAAAVPTTVILVQQEQDNRQLASDGCARKCKENIGEVCHEGYCRMQNDKRCSVKIDNDKDAGCVSGICIEDYCRATTNPPGGECGEDADCDFQQTGHADTPVASNCRNNKCVSYKLPEHSECYTDLQCLSRQCRTDQVRGYKSGKSCQGRDPSPTNTPTNTPVPTNTPTPTQTVGIRLTPSQPIEIEAGGTITANIKSNGIKHDIVTLYIWIMGETQGAEDGQVVEREHYLYDDELPYNDTETYVFTIPSRKWSTLNTYKFRVAPYSRGVEYTETSKINNEKITTSPFEFEYNSEILSSKSIDPTPTNTPPRDGGGQERIQQPTATPRPFEACRADGDQGEGQGCCSNASCQEGLSCTGTPVAGGLRCCPANTYWNGTACASTQATCQTLNFSCIPGSTNAGEQCCSPQFSCSSTSQTCVVNTTPTPTLAPNVTATPTPARPTSPPTPTVIPGQEACYAFGGQNGCTAWCQRSGGGGPNSYCDATCSSCLQTSEGSPTPTIADSCAVFGSHAACNTWCQSSPRNANGCNTDCNGCY